MLRVESQPQLLVIIDPLDIPIAIKYTLDLIRVSKVPFDHASLISKTKWADPNSRCDDHDPNK